MGMNEIWGHAIFYLSLAVYGFFWVWAVIHALRTPRATRGQRALWCVALIVNPATAIWYWYIWKRWAFWSLFTPMLIAFLSFPIVIRSILTKADKTFLSNILFALGTPRLVILVAALMIFPLVLRLVALLHIGKNTELSAMDRNDWVVSLALPVFGYGAGIAYCSRFRRPWAIAGLGWWIVMIVALKTVTLNITSALVQEGEEKRIEFRLNNT